MKMSRLMRSIFSYNGNVMLAAIISLLLVILFVLLLHIYAKWFLLRARRQRFRRRGRGSVAGVLGGFRHLQAFTEFDTVTGLSSYPTKGLDSSLIASIPLFLYRCKPAAGDDDIKQDLGLECVICLSAFEENDVGRALTKCGHAFHVECIDMWLHSHTTCPICRAPAVSVPGGAREVNNGEAVSGEFAVTGTVPLVRDEIDVMREGDTGSETMIDVEENIGRGMDDDEEVVAVVMDVFFVSVSVGSRNNSARQLGDDRNRNALAERN